MSIIKCKMCGGELSYTADSTVCECEYCGSKQTVPNADNEKKVNLYNRANRLRMNNEFDKASAVYESIVAEFPEEAEAYWGLCLCAYGIEYVDDPATGSKIPTCHRTLPTSIMEDPNFEQACDNADGIARKVYRDEAKSIDRIQRDILSIASKETPYDVFICYKETDESGSRTQDSVLAQEIYHALTAKNMKVFFSRISLEDKLGTQFEPYIYAALSSAKVMLAIGTDFEYYDAVWVKNEWSRFLGMMKTDKSKALIPCFKDIDAYDMPKEFKGLQAQDMAKLGWLQDLIRGVEKLCGKQQTVQSQSMSPQSTSKSSSTVENLMKRANLYLEDGDFDNADAYFEKVLDIDAEYAPAYIGKLCVELELESEDELIFQDPEFEEESMWSKALRFADENQKELYNSYLEQAIKRQDEEWERQEEEERKRQEEKRKRQEEEERKRKEEQERKRQEEEERKRQEEEERKRQEEEERKRQEEEERKQNEKYYALASGALNRGKLQLASFLFTMCADFRDSAVKKEKCIYNYLKQKTAINKELQESLRIECESLQIEIEKYRHSLDNLENETAKSRKEKSDLEAELAQTRGLFSGRKKNELQRQINSVNERILRNEETQQRFNAMLASKGTELERKQTKASKEKEFTEEIPEFRSRVDGHAIYFGTYPQTKSGNDKTPIEWLLLDVQDDKLLLLSRYGLDEQPYDTKYDVAWEKCTLRTWLNETFINNAFSSAEQQCILLTDVDNSQSQSYASWITTTGGNNTQDKVFLLSYAEADKYLDVPRNNSNNTKSRVAPTDYAIAQGAWQSDDYKTEDGLYAGEWRLRSPGDFRGIVAYVDGDGSLKLDSYGRVNCCVRPALWVDLEKFCFDN